MSITVKFFARLRETVKRDEVCLEITPGVSVSTVWRLATAGMQLPANTLMAVNMEYVESAHPVQDGDEVAFFPPVTGG